MKCGFFSEGIFTWCFFAAGIFTLREILSLLDIFISFTAEFSLCRIFLTARIILLQGFSYCGDFLSAGFSHCGIFFHCGRTLDKPQFYIGPFILRKLQNSKPTV